jgi:hypothetical protein
MRINTQHGGSIVYWNEPDGHVSDNVKEDQDGKDRGNRIRLTRRCYGGPRRR